MLTRFLEIDCQEVTFARRGFTPRRAEACRHLEEVGGAFVAGYNAAIRNFEQGTLFEQLNHVPLERRGFAFEGAAMGLAILDSLPLARANRWRQFLDAAPQHNYMLHVGLGWAWARLPWKRWSIARQLSRLDPLLAWLALDGFGFHDAFFSTRRVVRERRTPRWSGYALRAHDQGVGRALWFVGGADPETIHATLTTFPRTRQADLWAGVGLAMTYAGGASEQDIAELMDRAGSYRPALAQGTAFAAQARRRAGNPTPHAEMVCQRLWRRSAEQAAKVTDAALAAVVASGDSTRCESNAGDGSFALLNESTEQAFELWRQRIQRVWIESNGRRPDSAHLDTGVFHVVSLSGSA